MPHTNPLSLFVPFQSMEEAVAIVRDLQLRIVALEQGGGGSLPSGGDIGDFLVNTAPGAGDWNGDYPAALGKVDLVGFHSAPTLFDPASIVYDETSWLAIDRSDAFVLNWVWGWGEEAPNYPDVYGTLTLTGNPTGHRLSYWESFAESTGGDFWVDAVWDAGIDSLTTETDPDVFIGTNREGLFRLTNDLGGSFEALLGDAKVSVKVKAQPAQSDPLLDLQDSDATSVVQVYPNKRGVLLLGSQVGEEHFEVQGYDAMGGFRNDLSFYDSAMEYSHADATDTTRSKLILGDPNATDEGKAFLRVSNADGDPTAEMTLGNFGVAASTISFLGLAGTDYSVTFADGGNGGLQFSIGADVLVLSGTGTSLYGAAGLAGASRPAVPTQVAVVSVSDFNAIRTAMIALGIWTDGD